MTEYTQKQKEYIDSVGGQAHQSAIEIIGDLDKKITELEKNTVVPDEDGQCPYFIYDCFCGLTDGIIPKKDELKNGTGLFGESVSIKLEVEVASCPKCGQIEPVLHCEEAAKVLEKTFQ